MTNRLAKEKSPYLLQHSENLVDWFPWGEEAFQKAKAENKLIFLSIGYSTCYWCHVMEKDSFESAEVAALLNRDYVSIKVDREERPDVDKIYMDAVVAITGRGGWPMSVFLTPDRKPIYGATFFPRAHFIELLGRIQNLWSTKRQELLESASKITQVVIQGAIDQLSLGDASPAKGSVIPAEEILSSALLEMKQSYDSRFSGFGRAPKFPPSERIMLLFRIHRRTRLDEALNMATSTLEAMARGGIYDQLRGGFHRYSTDEAWLVPHFEKMLYDNALLVTAYLEGYQVTANELFASVARQTLDYVLDEMTASEGGFFSAQDAGAVGHEGEFYVWSLEELRQLLTTQELAKIVELYGVTQEGNFEHGNNILHFKKQLSWDLRAESTASSGTAKLLAARGRRERPHTDDKILTSWNGLMISAMAHGFQVLGDERYLVAAQRAAGFIRDNLTQNGELLRRYRAGDARFSATLDDYAYFIAGLIDLYQADFDPAWIALALNLQQVIDRRYWDAEGCGYFFSGPNDDSLITRRKEYTDEAIPSANSVAMGNLLRFYYLTGRADYLSKVTRVLEALAPAITRYPTAFASALIALDTYHDRFKQIVIVGPRSSPTGTQLCNAVRRKFLPNKLLVWGSAKEVGGGAAFPILQGKEEMDGQTTFYICEGESCYPPVVNISEALEIIGP